MSTKTNFKRIALVAVAALGLGVLSSVPSQATIANLTVTVEGGTADTNSAGLLTDSDTAATIDVSFLKQTGNDSATISIVAKSRPSGQAALGGRLMVDTYTTATLVTNSVGITSTAVKNDTKTSGVFIVQDTSAAVVAAGNDLAQYLNAKFKIQLDTGAATSIEAGAYVFTVVVTPYNSAAGDAGGTIGTAITQDVTITVSKPAAIANDVSAAYSTAILNESTATGATIDSTVSAVSTAADTTRATIVVTLKNAENAAFGQESITVTTDKGLVGNSAGVYGRSLTLVAGIGNGSGLNNILVRSDGSVGVATINISTPSVTFPAKKITFYSTTVSKITATKALNTLNVGSNSAAVIGNATDSTGNPVATDTSAYAYSSDTAVVSNYGTACTYVAGTGHVCALSGVAAGTAKITLRNKSTVALSTVASTDVVEVTVNPLPVASVKIAFDKATYAPGEKAYVILSAFDANGKPAAAVTSASALLSSTGITSNVGFSTGSDTTLVSDYASITTANRASTAPLSTEPVKVWTVYMPYSGGTVTLTAKGGTALPVAGQVALTATATITDNGAAALAAVNALATTVASLKTLITTLTNLVLKIQKKVKA